MLERLRLAEVADHPAAGLPYGTLKRVELARAVLPAPASADARRAGQRPQPRARSSELGDLIRALRDDLDLTVLLVEHNMGMVMDLCDQVVVLDLGARSPTASRAPCRRTTA